MVLVEDSLSGRPASSGRAGASRLRILQALRGAREGTGIQELADHVGLHANTVRFHLGRLVSEGVVVRHVEDRSEPGRPRLVFAILEQPGAGVEKRNFRLLASILAGCISGSLSDPAAAATQGGHNWGRYLTERPGPDRRTDEVSSIGELIRVCDDIGFDPHAVGAEARQEIWFRHCPFLEIAKQHPDVVCGVHLGLMQGALDQLRSPVTIDRLAAFVEPSLCVATLSTATSDPPGGDG